MADHQLKVYVGGKEFGDEREANVRKLALKYFPKVSGDEGNISALYNNALLRAYRLHPDTWEEIEDDIGMVAEGRPRQAYASDAAARRQKPKK